MFEQLLETLSKLASSTNPEIRTLAEVIIQDVTNLKDHLSDTKPEAITQDETPPVA